MTWILLVSSTIREEGVPIFGTPSSLKKSIINELLVTVFQFLPAGLGGVVAEEEAGAFD